MHGESFSVAIAELAEIRLGLMREKNPSLTSERIKSLADAQWHATEEYDAALSLELQGICDGSGVSRELITVLNNYTDFRDIQLDDQGCTVVWANYDRNLIAGQTWDMHGSAKNYVNVLKIPSIDGGLDSIVFSLVGCLGMMGYTRRRTAVGVNNINTDGATTGAMWPAVVRKTLAQTNHDQMTDHLKSANVTSGHNYLIASTERAEMWEVMPGLADRADHLSSNDDGFLFHTNHCVGTQAVTRETAISQNSTTHIRYDLVEKKIQAVRDFDGVYDLLHDHENYPKSICSNWQTNTQDPSITCGGAVGSLATGKIKMWRGDQVYDDNFVCHEFDLEMDS